MQCPLPQAIDPNFYKSATVSLPPKLDKKVEAFLCRQIQAAEGTARQPLAEVTRRGIPLHPAIRLNIKQRLEQRLARRGLVQYIDNTDITRLSELPSGETDLSQHDAN